MKKPVMVGQLLDLVETHYQVNKFKSTGTLLATMKHLRPHFEKWTSVTAADVEDYKDKRLREGAARASIDLELATLRRGFKLGIRRELVDREPTIVLFRPKNARKGFFEHEDYKAILQKCEPYAQPVVTFGYFSGARQGEILALKWDNYLPDAKVIVIPDTKNGEQRTVPVIGELEEVINECLREHKKRPGCPYIFAFHNGKKINKVTFNRHWKKACAEAKVNRLFHDLRRTAVRNLIRAGVDRRVAKQITGHKTDQVFERYNIVDERDLFNAAEKIDIYLSNKRERNGEMYKERSESTVRQAELKVSSFGGEHMLSKLLGFFKKLAW